MSKLASFLVGMGGGYIKAKDKEYERDRQAKIDERADWEHQQKVAGVNRENAFRTDMRDAARPAAIEEGAGGMVKPAEMDNRDVGLTENAALPNAGLMAGGFKVGNEAFADKAKATDVMTKFNAPESVADRQVGVFNTHGRPVEAMNMRAGVMDLRLKEMGLSKAEAEYADEKFNRTLVERIPMGKGWGNAFAKVLTDTQVGGLAGVKFEPVYSADGKSFEMFAVGPDGQRTSKGAFTEDESGWRQAMQATSKASLGTKINYLAESAKAQRDAQELAIKQQQANARDRQVDAMAYKMMGGGAGGGAGGSGGRGGSSGGSGQAIGAASFNPLEGFDPKNAQSEATALVDAQIASSAKPVSAVERARLISDQTFALRDAYAWQNTNRQRAAVFTAEARRATTPEAIEAVRERALASGYTPSEMAAMDPRFTVKAPPPAVVGGIGGGGRQAGTSTNDTPNVAARVFTRNATPPPAEPRHPLARGGPMQVLANQGETKFEPQGRAEASQLVSAKAKGFEPISRSGGEIVFVNKATGQRVVASQLFSK